jgi:hypothetical protein
MPDTEIDLASMSAWDRALLAARTLGRAIGLVRTEAGPHEMSCLGCADRALVFALASCREHRLIGSRLEPAGHLPPGGDSPYQQLELAAWMLCDSVQAAQEASTSPEADEACTYSAAMVIALALQAAGTNDILQIGAIQRDVAMTGLRGRTQHP